MDGDAVLDTGCKSRVGKEQSGKPGNEGKVKQGVKPGNGKGKDTRSTKVTGTVMDMEGLPPSVDNVRDAVTR